MNAMVIEDPLTPLEQAISDFNGHCHYFFALPLRREDLLAIARIARERGLKSVADTIEADEWVAGC